MKLEEIRAMGDEALAKQLDEAHEELFNLRFRLETKQLVNHRELSQARKQIARIETVIRERELKIR